MPRAIQIRGVPDEIHRKLCARAAATGLSLSDYLLEELSRLAARPPVAEVLAHARGRRGGVDPETIVRLLRAEREAAGGRS